MSLLCDSPSHVRAPTFAALVTVLLAGTALPASSQDTTVVGSGGSGSGVTVNMGVLDQGASRSRRSTSGQSSSGRVQLRRPDGGGQQGAQQDSQQGNEAKAGEPGAGSLGRVLRFPPLDDPKSHLTVDPEALASRGQDRPEQRQQAARPQLQKPQPSGGTSASADTRGTRSTPSDQQDSGLTDQGREMARQNGNDTQADRATQQQAPAAGSPSAPETPDQPASPDNLNRNPSQRSAPDTDGAGQRTTESTPQARAPSESDTTSDRSTASEETEATRTARRQDTPSASETVKPTTKPTRSQRDTGRSPSDARTGEAPSAESAAGDDTTDESAGNDQRADDRTAADDTTAAAGEASTGTSDNGAGETQTAKRTSGDAAMPGKLQLDFASGSAELSDAVRDKLAGLAERLSENTDQRIQLLAFAKGGEDGASRARRLSLSRALAVRSFLIDKGIRSTRMDVRALGDTAEEGPLDRVDIAPANR